MDEVTVSDLIVTIASTSIDESTSVTNASDFNSLPLVRLAKWVEIVVLPIVVILGVFGNVMTIVVVRRCQANASALDPYFLCLAASDLCHNITASLRRWIIATTGFRPYAVHDVTCKLGYYLYNLTYPCSTWFLVAMVAHRALSVVWPHRVNVLCTTRTTWAIIVSMSIAFSLASCHYFYGMYASDGLCKATADYLKYHVNVHSPLTLLGYSVLPLICLVISNIVLVTKLKTAVREAGDQFAATEQQQSGRERKVNSITLTVIVVSMSFIIFTLPLAVQNVLDYSLPSYHKVDDIHEKAFNHFVHVLFLCMYYFNFSTNFYMYCLTGQRFRNETRNFIHEFFLCTSPSKS